MFLALAVIFAAISKYVIPFLHLPNGGSISLVMVPLTLAVLILGPLYGLFVSLVFALINLTFDNGFAYNYMSLILDYFLAFSMSISCAIFRKQYYEKKVSSLFYSILIFSILRFICHFFSGVLISWDNDVSKLLPNFEKSNVIFSLAYNSTYILPSFIICQIALVAIAKPLFKMNDTVMIKTICPYENLEIDETREFLVFENVSFLILFSTLIASIIGCIPYSNDTITLKLSFFGYITLVIATTFLVLIIRKLWMTRREEKYILVRKIDYLLLLFTLINIAVSLCSILSYYTYGYSVYH